MRFLRSTRQLHLVINHKGSIVAVKITRGNVDERSILDEMTRNLKGSIFADKGFISKELFKALYQRGLKLITGIRRNMKNYLIPLIEKILLRKR
ncbi:MAG: transposase, partial [Alphaproteobacteria bacterium]|nr:transposase [Alphaproteobacteria bacterium]